MTTARPFIRLPHRVETAGSRRTLPTSQRPNNKATRRWNKPHAHITGPEEIKPFDLLSRLECGECGSSSVTRYATLTESRCPYPYASLGFYILCKCQRSLPVFPGGHFPGPSLPRVRVRPGDIYYDVAHTHNLDNTVHSLYLGAVKLSNSTVCRSEFPLSFSQSHKCGQKTRSSIVACNSVSRPVEINEMHNVTVTGIDFLHGPSD
ncbi:hypothetical protein DAPPUDRAFT_100671 [Daphnia pulex]|uniref:Uncharacterized protein n=1 Tax=Daphnia pulex TaxID=6669 RepID=E9GB23_DAPPU|nr:hypothetical protein DAPPUDRAFT_100671 [Daphnia pulex]|eukprot:EFX83445.1 hypothetical protein DAPPUDRAFT_100671 [Daphnia pulex]